MKLVFDIEADGLLRDATCVHILVAHELETNERFEFRGHDNGWRGLLSQASLLVGHNVISYDLALLEKLYGFRYEGRVHDTLLMSQILDYRRFGYDGHSLERWGQFLQFPKGDFHDFEFYTEEMRQYCHRDVDLNLKIYEELLNEYNAAVTPFLRTFIMNEHKAAIWQSRAELHGWPMDVDRMHELHTQIGTELEDIRSQLEPILGSKLVMKDKAKGELNPKTMRMTQEGLYNATDARWFGWEPMDIYFQDEPIAGPYHRVEVQPLRLSSVDDVKVFLHRHNWEPEEWNYKKLEDGSRVKTTPKITEESLEFLGGNGQLYTRYVKIKARHSVLSGWIEATKDGRLHGDSMIIGTPSMRLRHSVIANIPTSEAVFGAEFRSIFSTIPGWTLVGCDSSGNQARGLAYYLGDQDFIERLLHGDIHQYNADLLTEIVRTLPGVSPDLVVPRGVAKRILYAFLFGASGSKMWAYIFGYPSQDLGNALKTKFTSAVPGLEALMLKLRAMFSNTRKSGYGYIMSIADNRIYVDSFHKLLVYLLQATEKATCSAALALTMEGLEREGIPYIPLIYYHDEIDFMVPDEHKERAAAIGKESFKEGPKLYGINIMDGESKTGVNWLEIH